eukprot:494294-Rhodomonas_salina.1
MAPACFLTRDAKPPSAQGTDKTACQLDGNQTANHAVLAISPRPFFCRSILLAGYEVEASYGRQEIRRRLS